MTSGSTFAAQVALWIDGDPDPVTRAEIEALGATELRERFRAPLTFGTAGLRGVVRGGPNGMNLAVVIRTTAGICGWLDARGDAGTTVVVGRDARTGSAEFAQAAADVFAARGFAVVLLPRPLPTPVLAYAARHLGASVGVQITASHNPAADNGYKVYVDGGAQLIPPSDREIERLIADVGPADLVPRQPVSPSREDLIELYVSRAASLPRSSEREIRIALTPLHGVGGDTALQVLDQAGFTDVTVVDSQFEPDPTFPTVAFPNPEEPGAADALLKLAEDIGADLAIALDPDADRCAVGVAGPDGWRMLSGDETGSLLAAYILTGAPRVSLVANTIVSSRMLSKIAAARGARYVRTLTGFKWLVRAGEGMVYAYEEAIGHCVDPNAVLDKDGISAAVVLSDLVAAEKVNGRSLLDLLDDLAVEFGVHRGAQVSRRVTDLTEIADMMARLRAHPPSSLAGEQVSYEDYLLRTDSLQTDAIELLGPTVRVIVRPSGTEPKLKAYLEVVVAAASHSDLADAHGRADALLADLTQFANKL